MRRGMKFNYFFSILLLIIFIITLKTILFKPALPNRLDRIITEYARDGSFSGAVLIADRSGILIEKGYGFQDPAHTEAFSAAAPLPVADISRLFTKTALLRLTHRGLFSLSDSLQTLLPSLPAAPAVTLAQLLRNTAGISDLYHEDLTFISPAYRQEPVALQDLAAEITARLRMKTAPGQTVSYSSAGYVLLAAAMEKRTGRPYHTILTEEIFVPLSLHDTGPALDIQSEHGTIDSTASKERAHMSWYTGTAGLASTVYDLFLWERSLFDASFLPPGPLQDLGSTSQFGKLPGYASCLIRVPALKIVIIILSSKEDAPLDYMSDRILTVLLNDRAGARADTSAHAYCGEFLLDLSLNEPVKTEIYLRDETLMLRMPDPGRAVMPSVELVPFSDSLYLARIGRIFLNITVDFITADRFIINAGGWNIPARRLVP